MRRLIAGVLLAISLTACGGSPGESPASEKDFRDPIQTDNYQKGLYGDEFYTVDLDDRTCAVYNGDSKGGIYCWPKNEPSTYPAPVPTPSY